MFKKRRNSFMVIIVIALVELSDEARIRLNESEECKIPDGCRIDAFYVIDSLFVREYLSSSDSNGFICDVKSNINNHFEGFSDRLAQRYFSASCRNKKNVTSNFDLRFPGDLDTKLEENINLKGIFAFMNRSLPDFTLHLTNVGGFSVHLNIERPVMNDPKPDAQIKIRAMKFIRSKIDFYVRGKLIKSCEDLTSSYNHSSSSWSPNSIFQLTSRNAKYELFFINCRFRWPICPLMFSRTLVKRINFWGMSDYFYKQNMVSFHASEQNFKSNINSVVREVYFYRCENLVLDSKLLSTDVFKSVQIIFTNEAVKRIDDDVFGSLESLALLHMRAMYFRKLVHKQGIAWLKSKNRGLDVDFTRRLDIDAYRNKTYLLVAIKFFWGEFFSDVFPDADFCLYKDFPFNQLNVFIFIINNIQEILYKFKLRPTCTSKWLGKHYGDIVELLDVGDRYFIEIIQNIESQTPVDCDFRKLLDKCNKSNFHPKPNIWDITNTREASKYLQVFLASSSPIISLLGIFTNLALIYIIVSKKNNDLFKGCKHYPYLCAISVFNVITLSIKLVSWLSECNNTFDVFCPDTRRLVFFQFFKIIFKETIVVVLQFMSNFAYMGFAFNRIALIGKNHAKIVTKLSEWQLKNYLIVTGIISVILSVVKGFKYQVNYDRADRNYPIRIEEDLRRHYSLANDVYVLANLISDFLNYFVLVLVNLSVDFYMLKRLRRTLNEKLDSLAELSADTKIVSKKDEEMREAMNNAIRMVILSTLLNFAFKFPQTLVPLENVAEMFFFQEPDNKHHGRCKIFCNYGFNRFTINLRDSMVYYLLSDLSDWLLTLLISIQLFVYAKFDKKITTGLERILDIFIKKKQPSIITKAVLS